MSRPLASAARRVGALAAPVLVSLAACADDTPTGLAGHVPDAPRAAAASVAAPGTALVFLAPLGPTVASPHGTFDGSRAPTVEVCRWNGAAATGSCVDPPLRWTRTSGPAGEPLRVMTDEQHYRADWKERKDRAAGAVFRVRVLLDGLELGAGRLMRVLRPGETEQQVLAAGYVPISASQTVLLRFRMETSTDYLAGAPGAPAGSAIPAQAYVTRPEDLSRGHPRLPRATLSHNTILLVPSATATVATLNALLAELGAERVGGVPGVADAPGVLALRVPTATHAALDTVLGRLARDARVALAVQDGMLFPQGLPGGDAEAGWSWERTPQGGNWGLELVRAPQLWNLNPAVRKALARQGGPAAAPLTGVLDVAFPTAHPDLVYAEGRGTTEVHDHGAMVAGIAGATFDNGRGIQGVNPFSRLAVRAVDGSRSDDAYTYTWTVGEFLVTTLPGYVRDTPGAPVINVSLAYNWKVWGIDASRDSTAQRIANAHGAVVVRSLRHIAATRGDGTLPLLVAGAGNDADTLAGTPMSARWASALTNAALAHGARNIVVVGALTHDPTVSAGVRRARFSNGEADVLWAPGDQVLTTTWSGYELARGTSFAAPQVAGLAAYLYTLAPDLPRPRLDDNPILDLLAGSGETLSHPAGGRRVDAFAAAMGVDRLMGRDHVLRALLDVDDGTADGNQRVTASGTDDVREDADGDQGAGDGTIDMADFRRWRDWLLDAERKGAALDGRGDHPKRDVNGNGRTAAQGDDEDLHPRGDFNGDGRLSRTATAVVGGVLGTREVTDLQVLAEKWGDPEVPADSLPLLVESADLHVNAGACLALPNAVRVESRVWPTAEELAPVAGRRHVAEFPERVYSVRTAAGGHTVAVDVYDAAGTIVAGAERDWNALPAGADAHWTPTCEPKTPPPPPAAGARVYFQSMWGELSLWAAVPSNPEGSSGAYKELRASDPAHAERFAYVRTLEATVAGTYSDEPWREVVSQASGNAEVRATASVDAQNRVGSLSLVAMEHGEATVTNTRGWWYEGLSAGVSANPFVRYTFHVSERTAYSTSASCTPDAAVVLTYPYGGSGYPGPSVSVCDAPSGVLEPGLYTLTASTSDNLLVSCYKQWYGCREGTYTGTKTQRAQATMSFAPLPAAAQGATTLRATATGR